MLCSHKIQLRMEWRRQETAGRTHDMSNTMEGQASSPSPDGPRTSLESTSSNASISSVRSTDGLLHRPRGTANAVDERQNSTDDSQHRLKYVEDDRSAPVEISGHHQRQLINRKLDVALLPLLSLLYLFNGLDRSNVGNAQTQGKRGRVPASEERSAPGCCDN